MPEIVTLEPTLPLVGFKATTGIIVNVVEPIWEPASIAVTVLAPAIEPVDEPVGIMKDALKKPVLSAITGEGVVATAEPAYVNVTTEEAAKPEPLTATEPPTGPLVGLTLMLGVALTVAAAKLP